VFNGGDNQTMVEWCDFREYPVISAMAILPGFQPISTFAGWSIPHVLLACSFSQSASYSADQVKSSKDSYGEPVTRIM
jgi:hypothetical protein